MKTETIALLLLHNEEHVQFQSEFESLVNHFGAKTLGIEKVFAPFPDLLKKEKETLEIIRKSAATALLAEADHERDNLIRGLIFGVKSALYHFDEEKQSAAERVKILFDQFGNIAVKPYAEETSAVNKLLEDLKGSYAADVALLNLSDWIPELTARNQEFDILMKTRYTEDAGKTGLQMKQARKVLDAVYHSITDQITALILINGDTEYAFFVAELNARVVKYNTILARRKGRSKAKEDNPTKETGLDTARG
ncbi:MAG: DUF6261 family protein [Bacteroidetes bacterium]|nr:DUF6261 family protein [Bacteroidota bacterium]